MARSLPPSLGMIRARNRRGMETAQLPRRAEVDGQMNTLKQEVRYSKMTVNARTIRGSASGESRRMHNGGAIAVLQS